MLFIDDATRWTVYGLLRRKSETLTHYRDFTKWAKTQFNKEIKALHSDRGGKYKSDKFDEFLKSKGTVRRFTVHDVHEHNGVAERSNLTILDGIRASLIGSGLPTFLWGEALKHIIWIRNRTLHNALDGIMPYEKLHGEPPSLTGVREWGTVCWVTEKSRNWSRELMRGAGWVLMRIAMVNAFIGRVNAQSQSSMVSLLCAHQTRR